MRVLVPVVYRMLTVKQWSVLILVLLEHSQRDSATKVCAKALLVLILVLLEHSQRELKFQLTVYQTDSALFTH